MILKFSLMANIFTVILGRDNLKFVSFTVMREEFTLPSLPVPFEFVPDIIVVYDAKSRF